MSVPQTGGSGSGGEGPQRRDAASLGLQHDLTDFCEILFAGIRDLFRSENFYMAIYDEVSNLIHFPYFRDERDPHPPSRPRTRGMTDYVLFEGRVLWWSDHVSRRVFLREGYERLGTEAEDWIGIPLVRSGNVFGMIAIQTYDPARTFRAADLERLLKVGAHLSSYVYLKADEERLHLQERAIGATFDGIIIVDALSPDLPIVFVNPAFEKITGYSASEAVGRNCRFLQGNDRDQDGISELRDAIREGRTTTVLLRNYRKNGERFWNELHIAPIHDGEGRMTHVVGIQHDVTRRVISENALVESEIRFRELFEHAPSGTALCDRKAVVQIVNRRLAAMLGFGQSEWVGQSLAEFVQVESRATFYHMTDAIVEVPGRVQTATLAFRTKTGSSVDLLACATLVDRSHGGMATEIWQFEKLDQLPVTDAEHQRLYAAITQAEEMFVITDAEGVIQYVNPAFEKVTGYTAAEVIGQNPRMWKSGRHDASFYQSMWDVLSEGRTWRGTLYNRVKNGTTIEEHAVISPVRDASGALVGFVCVKRDVTRERAIERQVHHAQKMDMASNLAAGILGDINNLLVVMAENGEFVSRSLAGEKALRSRFDAMVSSAEKVSGLVQKLTAFSRHNLVQMNLININDVINGMEKLLRRMVGENVGLELRLSYDTCMVLGDAGQLEQVIVNLVVNARDALLKNAGRIVIETGINRLEDMNRASWVEPPENPVDRWVYVTVRDNGRGMTSDVQQRIFEPFYTTKENSQGVGMGLTTAFGMVKHHKGFFSVVSSLSAGSAFTVLLPLASEQDHLSGGLSEGALPRGTETILVVEDDLAAKRVVVRILKELGYQVLEADCGADGVRMALHHAGKIDLLFTDIIMPDFDGKTMADQIRGILPEVKVVYTSGYPDNYLTDSGVLEGSFTLIRKPYDLREIAVRLREVLDS